MDDEENPNLMTFVSDVNYLMYTFVTVVQFILGLSYLVGKYIVESSTWLVLEIWNVFCTAAEVLKLLFAAFIEFEESMIRAVFLAYYGIGTLFEAFQITLCDLGDFVQRLYESFLRLLDSAMNLTSEGLLLLVYTIPQHFCTALSIIGDSTIEVTTLLLIFIQNFFVQLFWSPINLILLSCQFGLRLAKLPAEIFVLVPGSAHVGTAVLLLIYVGYCKLSLKRFAGLIFSCCMKLYEGLRYIPSCIRQLFSLRLRSLSRNSDDEADSPPLGKGICVVCHDNPVCFIANPCNHVCLCTLCVEQLIEVDNRCPICRIPVDHYAKVFVS